MNLFVFLLLILYTAFMIRFIIHVLYSSSNSTQSATPPLPLSLFYTGNIYSYEEFPIVVYYDYNPLRKSNLGNEYNVVQAAINDINVKTGFKFFSLLNAGIRPKDLSSVLHISDRSGKHECRIPFDGKYGILAHSFYPPVKKICLDASEEWTNRKLGNTLVHELCHTLGLKHRQYVKSIMNPTYKDEYTGLQLEDIRVLREAYPFF